MANPGAVGRVAQVQIDTRSARLVVIQGEGANEETFVVNVVRDLDGIWRMEGM